MSEYALVEQFINNEGDRRLKLVAPTGRVAVVEAKYDKVESIAFFRNGRMDGPVIDRPGQKWIDSVAPGMGLLELPALGPGEYRATPLSMLDPRY